MQKERESCRCIIITISTPPANLDDIEMRIQNEIDILRQDQDMVRHAVNSLTARAELCLLRNGGHVED